MYLCFITNKCSLLILVRFTDNLPFIDVVAESYITHIRIIEDAAYPSSPSPPNSPPENKKPRLIIVALRKSGRVRMHKARENTDGSFSIGKTWMLDDLVSIQSYTDLPATTPQEQQQKQWASNVGFMVTIGKPYYWQAGNFKERDFFIASLVKIYKKYTGGRLPKLIGFDERQRQMLLGDSSQGPPASGSQASPANSNRAPSRDGRKDLRPQPSEEQFLKNQRSRDQISGPSPGQSPARPPPMPNRRDVTPSRTNGRLDERVAGRPAAELSLEFGRTKYRGVEGSTPDFRQDGRPPPSRDGKEAPEFKPYQGLDVNKDALRPSTSHSISSSHGPSGSFGQKSLSAESNEKLSRPSSRHDAVGSAPPSRGSDRSSHSTRNLELDVPPSLRPGSSGSMGARPPPELTKLASEAEPTNPPVRPLPEPAVLPAKVTEPPMAPLQTTSSAPPAEPSAEPSVLSPAVSLPERPATEPVEENQEDHRPGLGPMVKKNAGKDIAGALRKAANAYNAFRPRAGGAGERLMAKKKVVSNEPDGITSVVPAPLLRGMSSESTKTPTGVSTPSQDATPVTSSVQEPPKVEITRAATDEIAQPISMEETTEAPLPSVPETAEQRSRSRSPSQERRRRRREDNTAKYCQALGIDPNILEGRGGDLDDILTDLGWNGRLSDDKKIDDLEVDIRREIGRVQATSWLGNIEYQEGKIDQLARLIDKTIEECEELDGLLTLYSHELSVSPRGKNQTLCVSTNTSEDAP
jgi:hypothetical protein